MYTFTDLIGKATSVGDRPERYMVVDCETSAYLVDGEWEAMPRKLKDHPTPSIQYLGAIGFKSLPASPITGHVSDAHFPNILEHVRSADGEVIVVGHNLGFDYQHMRPVKWSLAWDTMIADYVLSAQANKFTSLRELMHREARLLPKEDLIGENMDRGIPPQDIPRSLMIPYLFGDIGGTEAVFLSQFRRASVAQRELIIILTVASLAYADCSANGLLLDAHRSVTRRDDCFNETRRMADGFMAVWTAGNKGAKADIAALKKSCVRKGKEESHWATTPTAMSSLLFNTPPVISGGTIPAPELGARRVRDVLLQSPLRESKPPFVPPPNKTREILSTADDILNQIRDTEKEPYASLALMEQRRRENHKLGTTYYQALLEQADRYCGRIHPRIHSTTTVTGRTSSSNPNIQNQPPVAREVFAADPGTQFLEFDFQQLEMWALAVVSKCPSLKAALKSGQDVHYLTGVEAGMWTHPTEMSKEGRRLVKRINFGLIYGGSAPGLAKQSRQPVAKVRKIINGFYGRFPGVKRYHDNLIAWVAGGLPVPPNAFFLGRSTDTRLGATGTVTDTVIQTATGRCYRLEEGPRGPSPTQLKNYPIQGFGTGDFVPLTIACLWGRVHYTQWRAVIHDAALLSTHLGGTSDIERKVLEAVKEAQEWTTDEWASDAALELNVSFETKDRWSPMEDDDAEVEIEEPA